MAVSLPSTPSQSRAAPWVALVGVAGIMVWAYWTTLEMMAGRWSSDPQYSHGWLVGPFAVVLLYSRSATRPTPRPAPSPWGVVLLALGAGLRLAGAWFYHDWLEGLSLLPCLAGFALLAGGAAMLRWSWPAVAFLAFMLPLPYRLETALSGSLQDFVASASAATLQSLGRPAVPEGNVLILGAERFEVVAACSGLGSLLVFWAMAIGLGLITRRPLIEHLVLVVSAGPIALAANVFRVVATVLLRETFTNLHHGMAHDMAGWLMMAVALVALAVALRLLRLVFIESPNPADAP